VSADKAASLQQEI